jgi:DMSO/TMAO reductase YedYZ molybdopterin-dependent catalytic subunit
MSSRGGCVAVGRIPARASGVRCAARMSTLLMMATRGFKGRRPDLATRNRLPPGQYETRDFPVLSAGPTPHTPLAEWSFELQDEEGKPLAQWSWEQMLAFPSTTITTDIHCVTKWSKFDTRWRGVTVDTIFEASGIAEPSPYVMAFADGGYTTNVPTADVREGRAMIAYEYGGAPLPAEHGGPARLLVPHLYFWKSAKWVRGLRFMATDQAGFWEDGGYHMRGDPWREQRYTGD